MNKQPNSVRQRAVLNLSLFVFFTPLPAHCRWIDETRANGSNRSTTPEAVHSLASLLDWLAGTLVRYLGFRSKPVLCAAARTALEVRWYIPCARRQGKTGEVSKL
ncbi:hypothetical protein HOY82DRAFT_69206 [Tuber indicum]|nr:hypothetical protein HOY82DRAFT_69206 [Tuber indicum]